MEQIHLQFDASEFEGFDTTADFFNYMARTTKDESGRVVKLQVQAMEMDYSPSHYSQKLSQTNNSKITADDLDKHTEIYGDTRWIEFAFWKHVVNKKKDKKQIKEMIEQLQRQLEE